MSEITINIWRSNPDEGGDKGFETYTVQKNENSTILEVLIQVYERYDSTLAFGYGCRVKNCGLCAMRANGRPCYACVTRVEDGMEIRPLDHMPVVLCG